MKIKYLFCLFVILSFVCYLGFSQEITVEQAIELAKENNPDLKKQKLTLEDAKRKAQNKWNKFLPNMSASANLSNGHDFAGSSNWDWRASAGANLSFSFALPSTIQQTQLNYLIEQANYQKLESQTISSVSTTFYSLIAEQQNIQILKESQNLAKNVYEQTRKNYNNGLASELNLLKSQYSYLSIEPQIQQAQTSYKNNLANFGLKIGIEDTSNLKLKGEIQLEKVNLPSVEELTETYLEKRHDVILSDLSVKQAELAKKTQGSSKLPSLSLSENLSLGQNKAYNAENPQEGISPLSVNGSFSIGVNIPLSSWIPGSQDNLTGKTNQDNITKAKISAEQTKMVAQKDIESKVQELNRLWNLIDVSKLNVSIATRSYELAQDGYRAGLVSQTDLETTRQQMVNAQLSHLQTQIKYLSANYDTAFALNMPIEEFYKTFGNQESK
ncbi:MAG: TolC family protein [Treponemataceae bacterium]|nr:TolC family protein [Treponemataceae bacterium]